MDDNSSPAESSPLDRNAGFGSTPSDLALSLGAGLGDLDIPLGFADQACKECRRRKSKCNKAIPTCNLCVKYRRHCLYEKHSRTPLTRKCVLACIPEIATPPHFVIVIITVTNLALHSLCSYSDSLPSSLRASIKQSLYY